MGFKLIVVAMLGPAPSNAADYDNAPTRERFAAQHVCQGTAPGTVPQGRSRAADTEDVIEVLCDIGA